jgi:thiol:disulfide interchange protein DsbA
MRSFLALLVAVSLIGCGRGPNPPPAPSAPLQSNQAAAAHPGLSPDKPADKPAPASAEDIATAARTQQEGADTGAGPTDSSEAELERIAALPPAGKLPPGPWVAGTHYQVLSPAQPTDAPAGKVEVVEMFWYGCPHCYALDPTVESWRKNLPAYVEFRRVPITWGDEHRSHARLFYTLKALGKLDELHSKVFDEIHQKGDLLYVEGDDKATLQAQLQFAKANGISESDFLSAYNSFGVQNSVQQADDLVRRDRIDSVPTFVINGKYTTDAGMAGSTQKLVRLLDDLSAGEKRH